MQRVANLATMAYLLHPDTRYVLPFLKDTSKSWFCWISTPLRLKVLSTQPPLCRDTELDKLTMSSTRCCHVEVYYYLSLALNAYWQGRKPVLLRVMKLRSPEQTEVRVANTGLASERESRFSANVTYKTKVIGVGPRTWLRLSKTQYFAESVTWRAVPPIDIM
jgi:hypothetical protein